MRCTKQLYSSLPSAFPSTASTTLCAGKTQCSPTCHPKSLCDTAGGGQPSTRTRAPAPRLHCGSPRERPCEELLPTPRPCRVGTAAAPFLHPGLGTASWAHRLRDVRGAQGHGRGTDPPAAPATHGHLWPLRLQAPLTPPQDHWRPLLRTTAVDRRERVFFNFLESSGSPLRPALAGANRAGEPRRAQAKQGGRDRRARRSAASRERGPHVQPRGAPGRTHHPQPSVGIVHLRRGSAP